MSIVFQIKDVPSSPLWKVCVNGERKTAENLFDIKDRERDSVACYTHFPRACHRFPLAAYCARLGPSGAALRRRLRRRTGRGGSGRYRGQSSTRKLSVVKAPQPRPSQRCWVMSRRSAVHPGTGAWRANQSQPDRGAWLQVQQSVSLTGAAPLAVQCHPPKRREVYRGPEIAPAPRTGPGKPAPASGGAGPQSRSPPPRRRGTPGRFAAPGSRRASADCGGPVRDG